MQQSLNYPRTVLLLGALGFLGLVFPSAAARAQPPTDQKAAAKIDVGPPPADINDLSMEVAALRTLYLLRADARQLRGMKTHAEHIGAQDVRKRQEADVSANYRKVLTDLRAAFIAGEDDRILELSDQLDELTKEEQPELDDDVHISDAARQQAQRSILYYEPNKIVHYLAAYGKDFPEPRVLLFRAIGIDGKKAKKPDPEEWKAIRDFTIREVSWLVGGLDPKKQQPIADDVAKLLDRAYALSPEELKKQKVPLREEAQRIQNEAAPTDILKHVIELDLAQLLSNPRLIPAVDARLKYLAESGGEKTAAGTP